MSSKPTTYRNRTGPRARLIRAKVMIRNVIWDLPQGPTRYELAGIEARLSDFLSNPEHQRTGGLPPCVDGK